MRILQLEGTPHEMGQQFGETCRLEIGELYALRLANALGQAREYGGRNATEEQLLQFAARSLDVMRRFHPAGADELQGVAQGSGLSIERIVAMNGLTDLRDALAWARSEDAVGGCSSVIAQKDTTRQARTLFAQTWDLPTDNLPYVVGLRRRPKSGPTTWSVTTVGCLSLAGMNDYGITVGTTNLRTQDARAGVVYVGAIHRALACDRFDDAVSVLESAPRAGGHSFSVLDASGRACVVECSATRAVRHDVPSGAHVQCNHALQAPIAALEADTPRASSLARHKRLTALMDGWRGEIDEDALESFLSDEANGSNAVCRDDFDGITTIAAIVVTPEIGGVRACHGVPSQARWVWIREPEKDENDG